jgi:hypothetical protein
MSCVKTLCSNLQCFVLWLKALRGVPSMISKDMSGPATVCDEHNGDTKISKASLD